MTEAGAAGRLPRRTGTVDISVDELTPLAHRAFESAGMSPEEAEGCASVCVAADLRGKSTHGIGLVPQVVREFRGSADRRRPVSTVNTSSVSETVDGGFHASLHLHAMAAARAAELAVTEGIGLVALRNAGVSGAVGVHADHIARRGLFALALNGSPAVVVPPGGDRPLLGTNPMAWAVPRSGASPVVLDMATSATTFNTIRRALSSGEPLPEGVVVDVDGAPTTDASKVLRADGRPGILPFGGHRGFALSLLVELSVVAALGVRSGAAKADAPLGDPVDFPGLYLAWRPDLLGAEDDFHASTEALLTTLGESGVRHPGQVSGGLFERQSATGIVTVDHDALETLRAMG